MTASELAAAFGRIKAALNTGHYECEDCWYSCPQHPDYCGEQDRNYCTCGADENARAVADLRAIAEAWPDRITYTNIGEPDYTDWNSDKGDERAAILAALDKEKA